MAKRKLPPPPYKAKDRVVYQVGETEEILADDGSVETPPEPIMQGAVVLGCTWSEDEGKKRGIGSYHVKIQPDDGQPPFDLHPDEIRSEE